MSTAIPTVKREQVKRRESGRCFRCGGPAPNGEWHHRRSRSVRDEHRHCSCNGVWLCHTCHTQVHASPFEARTEGFIVSRHVAEPGTVVAEAYFGRVLLDCRGLWSLPEED